MVEQPSRKRRIVTRAMWIISGIVLLLAMYLGSWLGVNWLHGRGTITSPRYESLRTTIFAPVVQYLNRKWPGHDFLWNATVWIQIKGSGQDITWREVQQFPRD